MRKELSQNVQKEKYSKIMEACQSCWKLLAYTTDTQNDKSIITWTKDPKTKAKTYFFNQNLAQEFIDNLAAFFYGEGKGLFLPDAPRPLLFEYRSILFGLLLSTKGKEENTIKIENPDLIERLIQIHQELIRVLRAEMKMDDPKLPKTLQ